MIYQRTILIHFIKDIMSKRCNDKTCCSRIKKRFKSQEIDAVELIHEIRDDRADKHIGDMSIDPPEYDIKDVL